MLGLLDLTLLNFIPLLLTLSIPDASPFTLDRFALTSITVIHTPSPKCWLILVSPAYRDGLHARSACPLISTHPNDLICWRHQPQLQRFSVTAYMLVLPFLSCSHNWSLPDRQLPEIPDHHQLFISPGRSNLLDPTKWPQIVAAGFLLAWDYPLL